MRSRIFERDGASVVVDSKSMILVAGSTVHYVSNNLAKQSFVINDNPNATAGCGCKSSFAAKSDVLNKFASDQSPA